jgi:hypothetical protein
MSQPGFTVTVVPGLPIGPDKDSRLAQRNDPLDASTFICPAPYATSTITIEFCDRVSGCPRPMLFSYSILFLVSLVSIDTVLLQHRPYLYRRD